MSERFNRREFVLRTAGLFVASGVLAGAEGATKEESSAIDSAKWGELVGRLVYEGSAPACKKLKIDKDVDCCGKFDIRDESLLVGEDGGLANVYIYVRTRNIDICPELEASLEKEVLLDNIDCIFKPHCLKIWYSKQTLKIVNSDPVAQNVAFSPLGDAPANLILPPPPNKAATATWTFRRAQRRPLPIACNYHPWESAFILPIAHPYCDISRADGTFRIVGLPPGELEFQLWHERTGPLETPQWKRGRLRTTIKPGKNDLGTIKLSPALFLQ